MQLVTTRDGRNYLLPFVLVTSLFFLWGFAHSILDVLNKYFQDHLHLTKADSGMIQAVVYGGYFLMALPAGYVIDRWGYRAGVLAGLVLYGIGALLFIPGGAIMNFGFFLFSLFVIGCGLTFLETSANPYVTILGNPESAERRINFSQSFNGLGWMLGPIVGGAFLFTDEGQEPNITLPYALIGSLVIVIALIFSRVELPEVQTQAENAPAEAESAASQPDADRPLLRRPLFLFGLLSLFLYVAAQTGINSFFINYAVEMAHLSDATASRLLGFGCMGLFMVGRMGGSWVMSRVAGERLLLVCALGAIVGMAVVVMGAGTWGMGALFGVYLCESIMFPTIFALALRGLGRHTKLASSLLIMSIVGGAIAPPLMGAVADHHNMALGFVVPLACFVVIALYAFTLTQKTQNQP